LNSAETIVYQNNLLLDTDIGEGDFANGAFARRNRVHCKTV